MRALVISCHTDDIELAAGGYVSRLRNVYGYCPTLNYDYGKGFNTAAECERAWKILHIQKIEGVEIRTDHPARNINRSELLNDLIYIRDLIQPTLVITHGSRDIHQSHKIVYEESVRAFKHCSILGYNHPWNCVNGTNDNYYVKLTQGEVDNKLKALECYDSQKDKKYFDPTYQLFSLQLNGMKVNHPYSESFEVIRWID